jgi:outer membrane immunogenic protein
MKTSFVGIAAIASLLTTSALAADLAPRAYTKAPPPLVAVYDWTGFYIGGNVGYSWGRSSTTQAFSDSVTGTVLSAAPTKFDLNGVIGGGQIGYNWQLPSPWLIGLEADLQGSGIKGSDSQTRSPAFFDATSTGVTKSIDWFGTVRGRVGFLVTPQWLLYGTGGLAYGETKSSFTTTDLAFGCIPNATLCANGASSGIRAGWTAGAGAEAMLAPNWSVKVEYLYVDLGGRSMNIPAFTLPAIVFSASTPFREQIARVGLNYHFDWAGPVVARY